ncbi:MAG: DUF6305 family protein [Christensenellaceae bacterium]|jgi:hypothetical protein|nr:DUF6305 family protein [Christensenellaceae bacterium]
MKSLTKAICVLLVCIAMVAALSACGSQTPAAEVAPPAVPGEAQAAGEAAAEEAAPAAVFDKVGEEPFYLTSVGQSADVSMVAKLLDNAGVTYSLEPTAQATDIAPAKTIIVAAGASSKGLGAAGISTEDEIKRGEEVLKAAKENGATIIALHIGGNARRGELSDNFTDLVFDYADYIIMTKNGDEDGKYVKFAADNGIPITFVDGITDCVAPLKAALGK